MSDLIAAYLFCAGAGSGAAFLAAVFECLVRVGAFRRARFAGRRQVVSMRAVVLSVYGAALVLLAFGMLCLVFDLGRPDLALKLFLRPSLTLSTFGAFALAVLALALMVLVALRLGRENQGAIRRRIDGLSRAVVIVASAAVMAYAGLLLGQADGMPLFETPWLAVLFVASALASGLAVVMLAVAVAGNGHVEAVRYLKRRLTVRLDVALIVLEAVAAGLYLAAIALGPAGTVALAPLLTGAQGGLFVGGFGLGGLAVPLALDLAQWRRPLPGWAYGLATAATLLGALALRFALVQAAGPLPLWLSMA